MNHEQENPKPEQNLPSTSHSQEVVNAKYFYDFLNGENFKKALETFILNKQADNSTFISKYRLDLVLVGLLLVTVLISGYLNLIDSLSTGTLIGAVVGYVLGSFRRDH